MSILIKFFVCKFYFPFCARLVVVARVVVLRVVVVVEVVVVVVGTDEQP